MVETIDRERLLELLDRDDVQLVDVLPPAEYTRGHIPGAINIPLKTFDQDAVADLDRNKPVAVY